MAKHALKTEPAENIVPFRPLSMLEEMERMMESFTPRWMRSMHPETGLLAESIPQVDVIDRDDHILVRAAMPGVNKDDLEVSTTDHTVTVRGKTQYETREEKGEYYRCEIGSGNFLRTVTLPAAIDEANTRASFKDGMLELTLPKLESAKRHTVKIETD
jgi:HSP20 family protein